MHRQVRLLFLGTAALAALQPSPLAAQPAAARARIKLDPERVIAEVHPHVFGNFVEQLGRCVYGGVFEEKSPLADADGFRKDVMEGARGLGVTLLRWPGGNFASGYNWKDGIGPRDQRPVRRDHAWAPSSRTASGPTTSSRTARSSRSSRTSASTPASARSRTPATGSTTRTSRRTPSGRSCAARTGASSPGT